MIYFSLITTFSLIEKRRNLCRKKLKILLKLAWNLHCQNCAKLIRLIKKFLFSKQFIDKHKTSPEAFTRQCNNQPQKHRGTAQAANLFSALPFNALVLLDRGYPAFWLFKLIQTQQSHFCARVSRNWKIIRQFVNSGKKEKIIQLKAFHGNELPLYEKNNLSIISNDYK